MYPCDWLTGWWYFHLYMRLCLCSQNYEKDLSFAADNKTKEVNKMRQGMPMDLSVFLDHSGKQTIISPQVMLAVHRYLATGHQSF